jgi:hypothetical protein
MNRNTDVVAARYPSPFTCNSAHVHRHTEVKCHDCLDLRLPSGQVIPELQFLPRIPDLRKDVVIVAQGSIEGNTPFEKR